jgi:two-component system, OmpR family, response regulator
MHYPRFQLRKGTDVEITLGIRSELAYLQEASNVLADLLAHTPLTDLQIDELKLAVMEMGWNAIEWGHCRNSDLVLRITSRIDPTSITFTIQDQGPGFNPRNLPHAASDEDPIGHLELRNDLGLRDGGFGIMLARSLVDQVCYNDQGNEVTLVKHFPQPPIEDC